MDYAAYIGSAHWRRLRRIVLLRDGQRCRRCGSAERLEVHHLVYPPGRQWKLDRAGNCETLCHACHRVETDRQRRRRYAARPLPAPEPPRPIKPRLREETRVLEIPPLQDHRRIAADHA